MKTSALLLSKVLIVSLLLMGSISAFAQATYTLEYASTAVNLGACGAPVQVKLKIQNTSASQTLNQTFTYGFNHAGLYFASGSTVNGNITFTGPAAATITDGDAERILTASILPNTSAEVTFNVRAGCSVAFGNLSSVTLTSPLKLIPASGSLTLVNNLTYQITQRAYLTYRESINLDGNTRNGDLVVRRYVITNQSLFTFNGVVNFGDKNMTSSLQAQSVKFTYQNHAVNPIVSTVLSDNPVTNAQLNGTGVVQAVSIPSNTWLIIEETVKVVGCVDLGNGVSLPVVRWGCFNYDYLPPVPSLDANITPPGAPPALAFDPAHTELNTDLNCFGSGNFATSHISFVNTSSTTARNVRLLFYPRDPVIVPVGAVRVFITRANGTVEGPYTVNYQANNITPDYMSVAGINKRYTQQELLQVLPNASNVHPDDLNIIIDPNPVGVPANITALRALNWDINTEKSNYSAYNYFETARSSLTYIDGSVFALPFSRAPLAHLLPQVGITGQGTDPEDIFMIRRLVINKLITAGGQHIDEIILFQNDRITVEFDEYSLCIYENAPNGNLVMSSSINTDVKNECGRYYKTADFSPLNNGNPNNGDKAYSAVYVNASGSLTAGVNNTQGNVDRCSETADGRVENIGFNINFPNMSTSNINPLGTLQFKLYLQDGLDLDRSLETPHAWGRTQNRGYNNLDNVKTACNETACNEQTCNPSTNVVSNANRYNFTITLRSGIVVPSSAITITRIAADKDISTIADGMYPITYNYVKNYYDVSSVTATFLYSITVDVPSLVALISLSSTNIEESLRRELHGARVSFDVRAYCPSALQKGASKWQMECSWIRCNTFVDAACGSKVFNAGTTKELSMDSYNAMPLFSVGNAIQVNCPGCKIPGTELVSYTLLRTNLGLVDADLNGEPDPGATTIPANHPNRRIVTHGDIMQASIGVTMPDGSEDTYENGDRVGCTKAQLDSRGYLLDNLYLKFTDVSEKIQFVPGSVQAALVVGGQATDEASLTWVTIDPADIIAGDGQHPVMVRIRASALGATEIIGNNPPISNFHTNHYIIVRASFKMFQYAYNSTIVEFNYSAGFSGCDDCTDFGPTLPAIPGPGLMADANPASKGNNVFNFDELDAVGDKAFFWCTNGGSVIRYVPFNQRTQIDLNDQYIGRSCVKQYTISNYGYFYESDGSNQNYDAFPSEYRRFFGADPLRHQLPIPTGYEPFKIYVQYYHRQGNLYDELNYVTIKDPAVLQAMISAQPANTLFNTRMDLVVNLIPDEDNLVPNQLPNSEPPFRVSATISNANVLSFPLDEENYSFSIEVFLRPANCDAVAPEINLSDNWNALYKPLSNIPTIDWNIPNMPVMNPHILQHLAATPTHIAVAVASYSPDVRITAPNSELLAQPQGVLNLNTSASYIQVPIKVDCANIDRASFPFFTVSGPAMQKGLTLVGVYQGNKNLTDAQLNPVNSTFLYQHYSITNTDPLNKMCIVGIDETAALQSFDPEMLYSLPRNSSTYFTLVFSYDCGSCIPIKDCKTPGAALDGQFCLNNDDLFIGYGWNCNSYPTFANLANVCESYDPLVYKVSTSKVGLTANHYINNTLYTNAQAATLSSCTNFTYDIELSSCYKGELNNFEVKFTLPAGVTFNASTPASITLSDLFDLTLLQDGSGYKISSKNPALGLPREIFNPSTPDQPTIYSVIKLSVPMTLNCSFTLGNIGTQISATTYCGTPVSLEAENRIIQTTYDIGQIDDIDFSQIQVQVNTSAITVNYNITSTLVHTNLLQITLPAAFVKQGTTDQHLITLTIPASGTGSETILITPVAINCNSSYPVTVSLIGTYPTTCPSTGENCTKEVPTHTGVYNINMASFAVTLNDLGPCIPLNAALTASTSVPGSYTYKWYNGTTLISGATSASYIPTANGIYTVEVSDGICTVTEASGQLYISPVVNLSLDNGATSSLMCNPVALKARVISGTPAYTGSWLWLNESPPAAWGTVATATWEAETATPTLLNISKHTATLGGLYMFTVTDANGCSAASQVNAPNTVKIVPPSPVCPGETPLLQITNMGNVIGTFNAGWFDASLPIGSQDLLTQITHDGYYKAAVIVPGCTLTTDESYHIQFKQAPAPFILTPNGFIFACADEEHTIAITNKSANDRNSNGNYYDDNISFYWSNGSTTLDDQVFSGNNSIGISAMDMISGCITNSSGPTIDSPCLKITHSCTGIAGQVKLTASSNFPDGSYEWWIQDQVTGVKTLITTGISGVNNRDLIVTQPGIYVVSLDHVTCGKIEASFYESMVVSASPNADLLDDLNGRFEGLITCSDPKLFTSELGCIDRSHYTIGNSNYINPANYGTALPGNYMISYGTNLNANSWNPGYWQGSGYNSNGFMIVDGTPVLAPKVVWSMDNVPVTMGHYHLFRAMVRNVTTNNPPVPQERPQVELKVTYYDASGNSTATYTDSRKILFSNTNQQWVELSGFTPSDAHVSSAGVGIAVKARIELVVGAGTALGRDFAIDNISFIPVGLCDNLQTILDATGRNCGSVASVDFYQKATCGGSVTFNVYDLATDPGITYTWRNAATGTIVGTGKSMTISPSATTNYILKVENLAKACSFEQTVTAIVLPGLTGLMADDKIFCAGGTVQLQASGATAYTWAPIAGLSDPNISNPVVNNLTSTRTYTVTGRNSVGCSAQKTITVTYQPLPIVTVTPATASVCVGKPITLTASGADTYSWGSSDDLMVNGSTAVLTPLSSPGIATVDISVTGTTNGCSVTYYPLVTRKEAPSVTMDDLTLCAGGNGDFNIQPANNSYMFNWNNTTGLSGAMNNPVVSSIYPRSFVVTIINTSTGCSVVKTPTVNVNYQCGDVAPYYDGVDDRTTIPYHSVYNRGAGEFTLEAWVNLSIVQGTTYPTILATRTTSSDGFLWSMDGSAPHNGKRMVFQILGTNYYSNLISSTLYDQQCHHFAVVRTSSGVLTFYIDGIPQGSYSGVNGSINTNGTVMTIGAETNGSQPLRGSISELRFWRYAFTAADVANFRYSLFTPSHFNLIGYWKFKQINTQVVVDESNVRNNGYYGNHVADANYDPSFAGTFCGGPRILSVSSSARVCAGKSMTMSYTTAGFPAGAQLQLFISGPNGVFSPGTPWFVTTSSSNSGTFTFIVPNNVTGTGFLLKLRTSDHTSEVVSAPFEVVQCAGLRYDGNDVARVDHHNSFNIGNGNFTLEAWVKLNSSGQISSPVILSKRSGPTSSGFQWSIVPSTNGAVQGNRIRIVIGSTTYSSNDLPSNYSLFDDQCHHLAVKRDGSSITFYLDGLPLNLKPSISGSLNMSNAAALRIGADYAGGAGFMKGELNEVRVWNTARSDANIIGAMYSTFSSSTANLIGYWRFKELPGVQSIDDESINNLTGYLGTNTTAEPSDPSRATMTCYANERISADLSEVSMGASPEVVFFPIPFDHVLNVMVSDIQTEETHAQIQLMNMNGEVVYTGQIVLNSTNELYIALPAGMYISTIRYGSTVQQRKVIKVQ